MSYNDSICPYIKKCKKYQNGECYKENKYKECGNFDDFELISSGKHESVCNAIINELFKSKNPPKPQENKPIKNICPFKAACYHIFIKPCEYLNKNGKCRPYECEDCEFNVCEYDERCDTPDYIYCNSYECITTIKEALESQGVYNTEDLKNFYGPENYNWLGGYIRAAFFDPKDILQEDNNIGNNKSDIKQEKNKRKELKSEDSKLEENTKTNNIKFKDYKLDDVNSESFG